ncbi:flagellar hook-length control protein FliK [Thalassolituus hydrocarboniclasticus]|uniref:Flagellar hook-length control protein FliK n=1 Tax=Thalassolituus hydrocarboniclasticus TaxID=2742796 RepID=A0ABY6A8Q9_9GAMM|nr:flagellar hook-length control protein FliK [Thalassolituus hydrocarboniclasticus]UXD87042.1 flagellar hook-length control protein FliK [Thalassolituus hydrocarboniclasticus]
MDASAQSKTSGSATAASGTDAKATRQSATQSFNARVISSIATDDGYRLTLEGQDNSGKAQTLQVNSQSPLPRNTVLTLQLSEDADGQMRLSVTDIKLPPQTSPLPETSASTLKLAAEALLASLKNNDKTAAQIPVPPTPVPPTTGATSNNPGVSQTGQPAAPLPALISQFLASRLPLLNTTATTSAPLSSILPAGVNSAGIYTNPARAPAGNSTAPMTGSAAGLPGTVSTPSGATQMGTATDSARLLPGSASALQQLLQQPGLPASVRQPLQQWLNHLPQIPQLQQPAALRESVLNSGLMYENKVMTLLQSALTQPAPGMSGQGMSGPGISGAATPDSAITSDSSSLFRTLWAKAGMAQAAEHLQTLKTALQAAGNTSNTPSGAAPASPADALTAALQTTRERLETATETPAPAISNSLLQKIEHLLHSDSKAAMGKALLAWLQIIAQHRGRDGQVSAPRELPLSLPAGLRDNLPEGFRLLHSTLAQLEVDQAQRLQNGGDNSLSIPLYFRDDQQPREIRLQLQKEETGGNDSEQKKTIRWRLKLHFELQQLGPLDVELDMTLPQVAATFWSEQQDTLAQLQRSLQPLRSRLQQMGVDVSELRARHGRLPETSRNSIRQSLVDVHS